MLVVSRLALMVLIAFAPSFVGALEIIEPVIPPGYTPELEQDERGIWMEMSDYEAQLKKSALLVRDPAITSYVEGVTCRVAGDYCRDIRVYVVRNSYFNASMAPNGMMQVWTGLLIRATSTDELSSVIGHEIAHYAMGHTMARWRRMKKTTAFGSIVSLGLGVITGVLTPIGEMGAMADAMAFSRKSETEADLLGAQFLYQADYDPHASYRVWKHLLAEEDAAIAKREAPGLFMRTHPATQDRMEKLQSWVNDNYGLWDGAPTVRAHRDAISSQYMVFMEDQIDTNRYGRTSYLLEQHARLGVDPGLVEFFRGEMYRQRGADGDDERAMTAYAGAIESDHAPAEAFRNLGYAHLKLKEMDQARQMFERYLLLKPDASDWEMIEFYLED